MRVRAIGLREEGLARFAAARSARDDAVAGRLGPDGSYWPQGWPGVYPPGTASRAPARVYSAGLPLARARRLAAEPRPLRCDFACEAPAVVYLLAPCPDEDEGIGGAEDGVGVVTVAACRAHRRDLFARLRDADIAFARIA